MRSQSLRLACHADGKQSPWEHSHHCYYDNHSQSDDTALASRALDSGDCDDINEYWNDN